MLLYIVIQKSNHTTAIEFNGTLQLNDGWGISIVHGFIKLFKGFVEVGDVSVMVLLMVELHDLSAYDGFQSSVAIRNIRKRKGL